MKAYTLWYRSARRVAVGVGLVLLLPLVAMLVTDDVVWSVSDFVLAGVLMSVIGIAFELSVRSAGNRPLALGIAAAGLAAAVLGEADDAPGLVLLGILLVTSALAVGIRTVRERS
jgi:hypothetical protein